MRSSDPDILSLEKNRSHVVLTSHQRQRRKKSILHALQSKGKKTSTGCKHWKVERPAARKNAGGQHIRLQLGNWGKQKEVR